MLTVPGTWSPYVCACKTDFWSFRRLYARTRVRNSIMTVILFRSSRFFDKAFVGKQQSFVGNDKRLSETTNACWKRQTLVGNDKRLSETTKLSRQINPKQRKAFVEMYHEPMCLVGKNRQAHACRSLSFFRSTYLRKRNVDKTFWLRLSKKRQGFVGNNKRLSETTKPCWKRQSFVGNDKAFFVLSSLKS